MTGRKRGLGRGLDALLTGNFEPSPQAEHPTGELREIAVEELRSGRFQPRTEIDPEALESLAQSIRAQGLIQPLVVRPQGQYFEIVAGERRWRAARLVGLTTVPALVRVVDDEVAMAAALIENIQREDLNPLEEAVALGRLIRECHMTHAQCAQAVGRSRAAVSNLLRLLDLNPDVRELVRVRALDMGHARALLALSGEAQSRVAEQVVARGASVRQTEALVRAALAGGPRARTARSRDPRLLQLESNLTERLQAAVNIEPDRRGGGRLTIRYRDPAQLDSLIGRID